MKFKKLLSAVAATAIAASAFAGMAVTASAAISITAINTISESTVFTFNDEDTADGAVAGGAYIELKNKLYYYHSKALDYLKEHKIQYCCLIYLNNQIFL